MTRIVVILYFIYLDKLDERLFVAKFYFNFILILNITVVKINLRLYKVRIYFTKGDYEGI